MANKPILSVIIPTYNNNLIYPHLELYNSQSARDGLFEIIVVNDGGKEINLSQINAPKNIRVVNADHGGPAKARNYGAEEARGERVLFVGDDCMPSSNLVLGHIHHHMDKPDVALQGFSPFHPDIMDTKFMHWLDKSGLQANWAAVREGKGWRKRVDGFLLTTNWSISRQDFEMIGGFPEEFPAAAWEDVALGHSLMKSGYATEFSPFAVNYHWHKHTIDSFMSRQRREGYSRIDLSSLHPEYAAGLLPSAEIAAAGSISLDEMRESVMLAEFHPEADYNKAAQALMIACSLNGVRDRIASEGGILRALPHVKNKEFPAYIASARRAMSRKERNPGYLEHAATWALEKEQGNWAAWAFAGEIYASLKRWADAYHHFRQSVAMEPSHEWTKARLAELEEKIDAR